jgi:CBS domain-containing protein
MTTTIKSIMCTSPTWLPTNATIQQAAQKMLELDCGFIPVGTNDKLTGIITDRDIATRATAKNLPASTSVEQIMSKQVLYCYETDNTQDVAKNMSDNQVRRLIVLNNDKDKKLVGIVSISDIVTANKTDATTSSELIKCVSTQSSKNNQSKAA